MYKVTTLLNKMKVITVDTPGAHGVSTAVFVGAGSRYEGDNIAGISHFIEHMVFKGTEKRPFQSDISRAIEGIGGHLNAATGQDHTFFYNKVPAKHWDIGIEVIADILTSPLLRPADITMEGKVIVEELNMYQDTPVRHIYDLIGNQIWGDNPLGRDIIGTKESILSVRRPDFLKYMKEMYQPENMVAVAVGDIDHQKFVTEVKKYFSTLKNSKPKKFKRIAKKKRNGVLVQNKKTDQAHLCLAFPGLPHGHNELIPLSLLDVILGTGMSSRLFTEIREKRGLCYSVHSFIEKFSDTGLIGITAGLSTKRINEAITAILHELSRFKREPVPKTELDEAKEFVRGTTMLEMDNTDMLTNWYGTQGLFYKKIETPEERIKKLLKVTQNDILKVANKIFKDDSLNLAVIGPFGATDKKRFNKLLKLN